MNVVAIKPAFYNGSLVRLGDQLQIPDNTRGSWFASPESEEAKAAVKIKASGSTPTLVAERIARGMCIPLDQRVIAESTTLSEGARVKHPSFIDLMR